MVYPLGQDVGASSRAHYRAACIRKLVAQRLESLGLRVLRLPLSGAVRPIHQPHIPVFVSANVRRSTKRLIVIFNHTSSELGILSARYIAAPEHGGIAAGSAVNLVRYIQDLHHAESPDSPGILLANPGQLLWSRRMKEAVTYHQWEAMPRNVPECDSAEISYEKNTIVRNRTPMQHMSYVLTSVVPELIGTDGKIQIISCADACFDLIDVLKDHCKAPVRR